jgi:twinfilin-like protein
MSRFSRTLLIEPDPESLIHDLSIDVEGTLQEDLQNLQSPDVLPDDSPGYILAKLDDPPSEWLAIYYVPDAAKVRDKASRSTAKTTEQN